MLDIQTVLKKNQMFAVMSETDRAELVQQCKLERISRGKQLHRDEQTQPIIVVGHGLLKTTVGTPGPSVEPVVRLHGPGDLANEVQLLDPQTRSLRIIAVTDGAAVCLVPRNAALGIIERNPQAALALARSTAKAAGEAYSRISSSRFSVESRAAAALLQLAEDYGDEMSDGKLVILLPLKRAELAGYIGSTTESLIRSLSAWRRDGTISETEEGYIEILNRETLEATSADLRRYHAAA